MDMEMEVKSATNYPKLLIKKTWQRCKSFGYRSSRLSPPLAGFPKSKSCGAFHIQENEHNDKSIGSRGGSSSTNYYKYSTTPSRSFKDTKASPAASVSWSRTPRGYFSVYVGPDRKRFVVRVELANHPLFMALLEEAEAEFGLARGGPLLLPCDADFFAEVLVEMEEGGEVNMNMMMLCGFPAAVPKSPAMSYNRLQLVSPSR